MDILTTLINSAPFTAPLIAGYLLDLLLGDPHHWIHPVKLFGNLIHHADKQLNKGKHQLLKGALTATLLVTLVGTTLYLFFQKAALCPYLYYPTATIMVFWGIANSNLIHEVVKVDKALTQQGTQAGRKQLSYIVGRDTEQLSPTQIRTAALETLSENLSDGVVAPIFYYLIGGIPAMFAYKMINTLDSMIGYNNTKYAQFGKFAARLDDLANLIPARLTALFMALVTLSPKSIKFILKYAHHHTSPNSGYPESALAGILNCQFGGPTTYQGITTQKKLIGTNPRTLTTNDLKKATLINHKVTILTILISIIIRAFLFVLS